MTTKYTPPAVPCGKVTGFPRVSKAGKSYTDLFYRDPEGTLHRLSIFQNESQHKPGVTYFKGMGEAFVEETEEKTEDA